MRYDAVARFLARLDQVRQVEDEQWQARCPAHLDGRPSLRVGVGREGRVLVHCHAGCPTGSVVAALGLTMADLFSKRAGRRVGR